MRVLGRGKRPYLGSVGKIAAKLLSDAKSDRRGQRAVLDGGCEHDVHAAACSFYVDDLDVATANDLQGLQRVFMLRV